MLTKLANFNRSILFWSALIVSCLALEGAALYYQYVMGYDPCMLCVHIRAWVFALLLAGLVGLLLRNSGVGLIIANALGLVAAGGMLERSYVTLGTEMGFVDGSCGDLGQSFPSWLPLDQWLPSVFKALESCGLTPWVIPQMLSMAEALIIIAGGFVLVMGIMLISSIWSVGE